MESTTQTLAIAERSAGISRLLACLLMPAIALVVALLAGTPTEAEAGTKGVAGAASFSGSREYVVLYRQNVDLGSQLRAEVRKGNEVEARYRSSVNGALLSLEDEDVNRLRKDERVAVIEPNGSVSIAAQADGSRTAASWGLDRVDQRNLPLDNRISTANDGAGVEAYVIDTGVRLDHTQFTGRVSPEGYSSFPGGWNDCHGHGTHVAGTVAGSTYGVAPAARVTAVRVLDCSGSGSYDSVIAGIDWVVSDHRAGEPAVANMSLGGGRSEAINAAVQRAIDDGVSMVVAAGNETSDACGRSPASAPNAVTVGSTTNADQVSSFSNYGRCVDLFAPGSNIISAWHTSPTATDVLSGTSMAAPHVAGIASLILSGQPSLSPSAVTDRLVASATPGRLSGVNGCTKNLLSYAGSGADLPAPPEGPGGPANDDFADRQTLSSLAGVSGSSVCATRESGEPSHGSGSAASIWYRWTAPQNGTVVFQTDGSSFDTLLAAYSGSSLTSLSQLASDDDSGSGFTSRISFPASAGTQYQIAIDGYGGAAGDTVLSGTFTPGDGGDPGDPGDRPSNDDFGSRTVVNLPGGASGSNVGATAEPGEPAHHRSRAAQTSIWYRWTAPQNGTVVFQTDGSSFDTVLAAYSGSSLTSLSQLASDDDSGSGLTSRISFPVSAGTQYQVAIDGYGGAPGDTVLSGSFTPEPGSPDPNRPANDDFGARSSLDSLNGISASSVAATSQSGEPRHYGSQDATTSVWWRWTAPSDGNLILATAGSDFDTLLAIYKGGSFPRLERLGSDDDSGPGTTSRLAVRVVRGVRYSIVIDGFEGASGAIRLAGSFTPDDDGPTDPDPGRPAPEPDPEPDPEPGPDPDPDEPTWLPRPTLQSSPARRTRARNARFAFSGHERATFQCRFSHRRYWTACGSPTRLGGLRPGRHVFRVRQVAGQVESAATTYRWRVVRPSPR